MTLQTPLDGFLDDLVAEASRRPSALHDIIHEGRRRRRRRAVAVSCATGAAALVAVVTVGSLWGSTTPDIGLAPATAPSEAAPAAAPEQVVRGALPDGRPFTLTVPPERDIEPEGIAAVVVEMTADGHVIALGETTWLRQAAPPRPVIDDGRLRVGAGGWTMDVLLYDEVDVDALEASLPRWRTRLVGTLPVLEPADGYRVAREVDLPVQQAIYYPGFTVIEGCDPARGICTETREAMVVADGPDAGPQDLQGITVR